MSPRDGRHSETGPGLGWSPESQTGERLASCRLPVRGVLTKLGRQSSPRLGPQPLKVHLGRGQAQGVDRDLCKSCCCFSWDQRINTHLSGGP